MGRGWFVALVLVVSGCSSSVTPGFYRLYSGRAVHVTGEKRQGVLPVTSATGLEAQLRPRDFKGAVAITRADFDKARADEAAAKKREADELAAAAKERQAARDELQARRDIPKRARRGEVEWDGTPLPIEEQVRRRDWQNYYDLLIDADYTDAQATYKADQRYGPYFRNGGG